MADINSPKTPQEDRNELSVGSFAAQQTRTLGFQLGGMALGIAAGWGLTKTGFKNTVGKWIADYLEKDGAANPAALEKYTGWARKYVLPIGGMVVGSMVGGIASFYEHWVKVERERLSVQEINKDVANIMEKRVQFEETIDKQHQIVQDMLKKHEASAGQGTGEKIRAAKEELIGKSAGEKVRLSEEQAAPAETQRPVNFGIAMAFQETTSDSAATLKEQHVPLEQRKSQNLALREYVVDHVIKDVLFAAAVTGAGFLAGHLLGARLGLHRLFKKDVNNLPPELIANLNQKIGGQIGAFVGGFYGLFHHWRKVEGQHLGVKNISTDLKAAMDPAHMESEMKKEEALLADLKKLDEKLATPKSHTTDLLARREAGQQGTEMAVP